MAQRIYKSAVIYDARMAGMRNLWEPSTEYRGQATQKPNYLASIVIKKTRQFWWEEPVLAGFMAACTALHTEAMSHLPIGQVMWPVKDGDQPDDNGRNAEWRAGNWILTGSSTSPIEVSIMQNGVAVPLRNRTDVKSGDHVMAAVALAVNSINNRAVKVYLNKVIFTKSGEEILIGGGGVSTTEMIEAAKAQGMNVTGFGGGAPQQGFGTSALSPGFGTPVGFPGNGTTPGFAPPPVQPPGQQGFTAPATGFNAPTGFPPRQ